MAQYKIRIKKSAGKELEKINFSDRNRIIQKIRSLADDPRPPGAKKLSVDDKYRIRQGNYRILYQIFDEIVSIVVVKVGDRRDVYRK